MPITSLTFWLWGHNEFTFLQSLSPSPLWHCQLVLSLAVEEAGMGKGGEVDEGSGGEELHCPLLCCSYQVCLRTGVLSEIPLKCSGTDTGSCKSRITYINEYVQRLGIKPDWGQSPVWQIHMQICMWRCSRCTRAQLCSWSWLIFLFLFLWCLFSCYCNHAAQTSVCSAGGMKASVPDTSCSATVFQCCGVCQGWWGGEASLEALEGRVCSFLQYTCKDRMLLCLAWVPLDNKTFSVKYLAQTSGGMLKTHPQ